MNLSFRDHKNDHLVHDADVRNVYFQMRKSEQKNFRFEQDTRSHCKRCLLHEVQPLSNSEHVRRERGLECSPSPHTLFSRNPDPCSPFVPFPLFVFSPTVCRHLCAFHSWLLLTAKMGDSSDAVSCPKAGISDLPDELFILILMLLPFPDQVRVRRVSTYWRTAVHYLFERQEMVRIALKMKEVHDVEDRERELDSMGFNFDSGVNVFITYPFGDIPQYHPECPVKRQAVTRFCSAVNFAMQHLNGIRVAEISWGLKDVTHTINFYSYTVSIDRNYTEQDRDRMHEVCNKFASRFQKQLLCFVSPMFNLTPDYFFPVMKHVTLLSVSQDIRSMFQTVTPKLVSLLADTKLRNREGIHPDNFMHLPADFRCISLSQNTSWELLLCLLRCRKAIQSIRCDEWKMADMLYSHPIRFPSLRCLKFRVRGWHIEENFLTMNASGLQHLQLKSTTPLTEHFCRLPAHVTFHNLQTLITYCDCEILLDILSRASHRLKRLIVIRCHLMDRRNVFAQLSKIKFLTVLKITFDTVTDADPIADLSFSDSALMLLRGGSRSTIKHFRLSANMPMNDTEAGEIAAELRLMQESESLESAIVEGSPTNYRLQI